MRKTFLLPVLLILLALTFIMVSCENNVYLPEGDTWAVRDMYFSSFSDALAWLMGQGGGTSKGLVESNIQDDMTITLLRNVEEGGEGIKVPKSFTGELCIDFNGHSYQFKKDLDNFFEFLGGVKIDVINGTSIIPGDSASENKALIVDVNTVTVDDHLIEDRRPVPQAVQIGPNGILVINSSSGRSFGEDEYSIDGVFSVSAGGSLAINGGKVHISDINGLAEESDFTIAGGIIINPDRINGIIDTAIEDGGHPENVQQEVYHELGDWVKTDALVHYKACSFCDQHFEEAEHTFTEWQEDENHNYFRDCAVCGRHETKDHIHNLEHHDAVSATCTTSGNTEYWYCGICGKYYSDEAATTQITFDQTVVPKLGHVLEKIARIEPTCDTDGREEYYHCTRCEKNYYTNTAEVEIASLDDLVIPAIHHANKVEHPEKAATCVEDGNEQYWSCPDCGKYFSDEACEHEISYGSWVIHSPGAHDLTEHVYHAATCTEPGNNAYWSCSVCSKYFSDSEATTEIAENSWIIPALGHNKTAHEAHDATCTDVGNSAYWSCDKCGKYFSDEACTTEIAENSWVIPATGHAWGDWITTTEPTCTTSGVRQRVCAHDANHKETETIGALGHNMSFVAEVPAKCEETGIVAHYHCETCDKNFEDEAGTTELQTVVIPATGHQWGEWTITIYPTCTTAGERERICAHDATHKQTETIGALGHNMSFVAEVPAKCEETGIVAHYHCDNCSKNFEDEAGTTELQTVVIPVLGHDWSAEWTHGEIDNVHYHWHACSRCDAHGDEAACLDTAVYEHDAEGHWQVCSVCDALLSDKAEHVWDDEVRYDSERGLHYVECTVCAERLYDELAEVSVGDYVIRTGDNPPMGIMTVTEESGGTVLRIRYVAEEGESITALRCRYLSDGEWSPYIEQGADGSFVITVTQGTEYRIVLEAETAEGRSEYIKVVMSVTN